MKGSSDGTISFSSGNERRVQVAVIIVNYNAKDDLIACLESLRRSSFKDFVVVVVDNASQDGSHKIIPSRCPEVVYLHQHRNLGWGAANNIGVRWAKEQGIPYVWLLNADTLVHERALEALMEAVRLRPHPVMASAHLMHYDRPDQEQYAGSWFDVRRLKSGLCASLDEFHSLPLNRRWLWATALLVPTPLFNTIGFLPEDYFVYCEDMALSVRAAMKGIEQIIVEQAIVRHRSHAREGVVKLPLHYYYYTTRNHWLFWNEITPWYRKPFLWRKAFLGLAHEIMHHRRLGHEDVIAVLIQGLSDGIIHRVGCWDGRKSVPLGGVWRFLYRKPTVVADVLEGRVNRLVKAAAHRLSFKKAGVS